MAMNSLTDTLLTIARSIDWLETYETELWEDQSRVTSKALIDLANALDVYALVPGCPDKEAFDNLREQAVEARLQVAALIPHCHSRTLGHLRQRKQIAALLRLLVEDKLLIEGDGRAKPTSIQLVTTVTSAPVYQQRGVRNQRARLASRRRVQRSLLHRKGADHE